MVLEQPNSQFRLLQFIALALPAIAIYLQVLVSIYKTETTLEIKGQVPTVSDEVETRGIRIPEIEPYVIQALPALNTKAASQVDFVLSVASIAVFLLAGFVLTLRFLIVRDILVTVASILIMIAIVMFGVGILLTIGNASKAILGDSD